jgi:hypothetical protein
MTEFWHPQCPHDFNAASLAVFLPPMNLKTSAAMLVHPEQPVR